MSEARNGCDGRKKDHHAGNARPPRARIPEEKLCRPWDRYCRYADTQQNQFWLVIAYAVEARRGRKFRPPALNQRKHVGIPSREV